MICCQNCYSPLVNENSLRYEGDLFCSLKCFQAYLLRGSTELTEEDYKEICDEYHEEAESMKETIRDLDSQLDIYKEHLEKIFDKLDDVYGMPDNTDDCVDLVEELVELYNEEGIHNGR